jgi:hypothetical protein
VCGAARRGAARRALAAGASSALGARTQQLAGCCHAHALPPPHTHACTHAWAHTHHTHTPHAHAPQELLGLEYACPAYDMWRLGCLMYTLATSQQLFTPAAAPHDELRRAYEYEEWSLHAMTKVLGEVPRDVSGAAGLRARWCVLLLGAVCASGCGCGGGRADVCCC